MNYLSVKSQAIKSAKDQEIILLLKINLPPMVSQR